MKTEFDDIIDQIGLPAMLEQTAEESVEFAQACLKYARIVRKENPTPMTSLEALDNLREEAADVLLCVDILFQLGMLRDQTIKQYQEEKLERWISRLKAMKEEP